LPLLAFSFSRVPLRVGAVVALLTLTMACGRAAGDIEIRFEADEAGATRVEVSGLSSDEVRSLAEASLSDAEWQQVLRVTVAGGPADQPGVAGAYEIADDTLRFLPMFPFNPGRRYDVTLDRARVPRPHDVTPVSATLVLPAVERAAETGVTRVMPTTEAWPENLLRI
jgi:hypothetical protein